MKSQYKVLVIVLHANSLVDLKNTSETVLEFLRLVGYPKPLESQPFDDNDFFKAVDDYCDANGHVLYSFTPPLDYSRTRRFELGINYTEKPSA